MRKLAGPVFLAALAVVLVAGCSVPSNTPDDYNDATRTQFIEGCMGTDDEGDQVAAGATQAYCECAYGWISSTYPYSEDTAEPGYVGITFSSLNGELGSEPTAMPSEVSEGLAENCDADGSRGVSPATTVAPATTLAP